jgi:hypothetical protein
VLNLLKKNHVTVFGNSDLDISLKRARRSLVEKLGSPRFGQITWRSIRHYWITPQYMELKDPEKTRLRTGHKSTLSLMRYVHLAEQQWEDTDKFHYAAATTHKESGELLASGWKYELTTPAGTMQFTKPKKWNEE